jgi:cell division protein FtsB
MLVSRVEGNTAYADYSTYHNRVHKARRKASVRKKNPMLTAGTVAIVFVGLVLLYLFQLSFVTDAGYRMLAAQNELAAIKNKNKALSVELARLTSYPRIDNLARNELQMVAPKNTGVLAVKFDSGSDETVALNDNNEEYAVSIMENLALKRAAQDVFVKIFSRVTASWFGEFLSYLL